MSVGNVFDYREVISCAEVGKSKVSVYHSCHGMLPHSSKEDLFAQTVYRMMMGIRDRPDGTILKHDIFNAVFVFASDAEK